MMYLVFPNGLSSPSSEIGRVMLFLNEVIYLLVVPVEDFYIKQQVKLQIFRTVIMLEIVYIRQIQMD